MAQADPRMSAGAIVLSQTLDLAAVGSAFFAAPEQGYIKEVHVIRDAAAGAGATILTITTGAGAVAPTMTLPTGGAAGDVDSFEFSKYNTNNEVKAGAGFSIDSGGQFAVTPNGEIVVVLEPF